MSLIELLVVVALLSIVLGIAFQGLVSYQNAVAGADARQQNLDEARPAMAALTRDLRTAVTFLPPAGDDVTFQGYLNTTGPNDPPNQVRLCVDGQRQLLETVAGPTDPPLEQGPCTVKTGTRILGRWLVDTPALFAFPDANTVMITLSVQGPFGAAVPATVLQSRVWLPNVTGVGT